MLVLVVLNVEHVVGSWCWLMDATNWIVATSVSCVLPSDLGLVLNIEHDHPLCERDVMWSLSWASES